MRKLLIISLFVMCGSITHAQTKSPAAPPKPSIPAGAKFYVTPMEGEFQGFITAELIKRKLPIVLVTEDTQADYIITGASVKGEHRWYDTVVTGIERDKKQGNIQLINTQNKTVIWAAEAGDRSLWWGSLKRGGRRKVAERLVGKLKTELFKK